MEAETKSTIGALVRRARLIRGLSLEQAAAKWSASSEGYAEAGDEPPGTSDCAALLEQLEADEEIYMFEPDELSALADAFEISESERSTWFAAFGHLPTELMNALLASPEQWHLVRDLLIRPASPPLDGEE